MRGRQEISTFSTGDPHNTQRSEGLAGLTPSMCLELTSGAITLST
jgi:hypothetical protein